MSRYCLRWIPIQTVRVEYIIRGREPERKELIDVLSTCVFFLHFSSSPSLPRRLPDKVLSSSAGRCETPLAEPHTKTLPHSSCLPLPPWHAHCVCGCEVGASALADAHTAGERCGEELGAAVVVGPWAPRPAGGAGQPLLASLPCIDFCCFALLHSSVEAPSRRRKSSVHPPHLPFSWLGWPGVPTLQQRWLAPDVSPGPLCAPVGPHEEGSQRAYSDPHLCSPAPGSPASNHLLE